MKCEFCRSEVTITYPWLNPLSAQQSDCVMLCANCKEMANSRWATIPRCKCCNKVGPWVVCPSCDASMKEPPEKEELKFNGIEKQAEEASVKHDSGKVPYSYVPLDLLDGTARVLEFGAKKYDRHNFRKGFDPNRLLDAVLRHLTEVQNMLRTENTVDGLDNESGLFHGHHAIADLLILVDTLRKKGYTV
jgi:hypothetical protein